MEKQDIKSLYFNEVQAIVSKQSLPSFRAKQIYKWIQQKGVSSFDEMTDLPKGLIKELNDVFVIKGCKIKLRLASKIDETVKFVFELYDGEFIESVLMKYKYGYTLCVSTQVGCKMGCKFCASTINGCKRSLSASEILSQIHCAQLSENIRISHIVLMGMGEPLDNYNSVIRFIRLAGDENGLNLSIRNISVSTCGLVPKIYDLLSEKLPVTLSVSLHAPTDEIRNQIMPVNKKWGVEELLVACRDYAKESKRRISFEYSMISGVNDSDECAYILAQKLRGMLCHVNLIPINTVKENTFVKSEKNRVIRFMNILESRGINATVRRTLGSDIDASCGQLRSKLESNSKKQ